MRRNISGQVITAQLINSSDGSAVTTGTTNVFVLIDGGTQTAGTGTITHEGNGNWSYAPTQAETNGNHISFTFTNSLAIPASLQVYTISFDPHNIASLGLTNLDATVSSRSDFDATSDAVANVTLVATTTNVTNGVTASSVTDKSGYSISGTVTTLDDLNDIAATDIVSAGAINTLSGAVVNVDTVDVTTTNTDMRGTDGANTIAPDNTSITAILADTNELQTNQGDWATATGFSTINPDNASITAILVDTGTTIPAQINALNNFNPATDTVANVTSVSTTTDLTNGVTVTTNNDKSGYSIAGTISTLDALNNFDPSSDAVINVTTVGTVTNGVTVSTNNDKLGYSLSQSFPANFASMDIDVNGNTNSFVQGFVSTGITETSAGRIANNFDQFYDNGDVQTTKVVDDVGTAVSGGGEFTTLEKNQIRFRLGMDGAVATPTATPDLSQKSDITALNDFDPSTDPVANVTLVATTTTNTDMRGTDNSLLAANYTVAPTTTQITNAVWDEAQSGHTTVGTFGYFLDEQVSAGGSGGGATPTEIWSFANRSLTDKAGFFISGTKTTLDDLNDFDSASDVVANVTLVDTTTANTDMRGTDSALLASSYVQAPTVSQIADGVWDEPQSGHTTLNTFGYFLDSRVSEAGGSSITPTDIWTFGNRSLTDKDGFTIAGTIDTLDGLNNISTSDVWSNSTRTLSSGVNIVLAKGVGVTGFNDLSFDNIWTGQLTESYAADGVAPTPTQSLFLMNQFHQDFSIVGTSYRVNQLDGTTVAATFTLDAAVNPTGITRSA